jgi:CubicO group peptidase (beta-lactamase class C family)
MHRRSMTTKNGTSPQRARSASALALMLVTTLVACGTDGSTPAAATGPTAWTGPTASDWAAFERVVAAAATDGSFSGAVLVAKNGEPLVARAHGPADRQTGALNDVDTRFNLGSVAKMFTGVAVAQLVEAHKLSFGDTVGQHLAGFPPEIADHVTIDQLLTHTSGLGDFMRNAYPEAAKRAQTATDLLPLVTGERLLFAPGTNESYSNSGYVVLGAIIEAVTGQSYYDYVRDHVFAPAGMARTDWSLPGQGGPDTARGYMRVGSDGRPVPPSAPTGPAPGQNATSTLADNTDVVPWGNPSGGAYSTVGDLQRFARALLGHELLSPEVTRTVMTGKVPIPNSGAKTGYGVTDGIINGVRIVGHGAGAHGVAAAVDIYPDLGYVVVVLANYDGAAQPIQDRTRAILTGAARPG